MNSDNYEPEPFFANWIMNNDVIRSPIIDVIQLPQYIHMVIDKWAFHIEPSNLFLNIYAPNITDEYLNLFPRIIASYIKSLPNNVTFRALGFNYNFVIDGVDFPSELRRIFSSNPRIFNRLFGHNYLLGGGLLWKNDNNFQVSLSANPAGQQVGLHFNYHRDIESRDEIFSLLNAFMSTGNEANTIAHELMR